MNKTVRRGYCPDDEKEFDKQSLEKLHAAGRDLFYLLNQGYPVKSASVFVGNHYLLSERQRLAMVRGVSARKRIEFRSSREVRDIPAGSTVNIDGFNTIITLEVALSGSLLIKSMDETIRDLAALRGTYRLIDKTDKAILLIGQMLEKNKVGKAIFYLDSPVSNSGRLKQRIMELMEEFKFEVQVEVIHDVDSVLEKLENVITSDAIILDKCISWINLNRRIIDEAMDGYPFVKFSPD